MSYKLKNILKVLKSEFGSITELISLGILIIHWSYQRYSRRPPRFINELIHFGENSSAFICPSLCQLSLF